MARRRITDEHLQELIRWIEQYRKVNQYSPTVQEIANELGLSKGPAFDRVAMLKKRGYLTSKDQWFPGRTLVITPKGRAFARRKVETEVA